MGGLNTGLLLWSIRIYDVLTRRKNTWMCYAVIYNCAVCTQLFIFCFSRPPTERKTVITNQTMNTCILRRLNRFFPLLLFLCFVLSCLVSIAWINKSLRIKSNKQRDWRNKQQSYFQWTLCLFIYEFRECWMNIEHCWYDKWDMGLVSRTYITKEHTEIVPNHDTLTHQIGLEQWKYFKKSISG